MTKFNAAYLTYLAEDIRGFVSLAKKIKAPTITFRIPQGATPSIEAVAPTATLSCMLVPTDKTDGAQSITFDLACFDKAIRALEGLEVNVDKGGVRDKGGFRCEAHSGRGQPGAPPG